VKEFYPDATILRPGSMYGDEDRMLARIAGQALASPVFPLIEGAQAKRSPISYEDVAEAIGICLRDPSTVGQTYDLAGPNVYTQEEVYDLIFQTLDISPFKVPVPHQVMALQGRIAQYLPMKPLTEDEVYLALEDEVVNPANKSSADLPDFAPKALEDKIGKHLLRFKAIQISAKDAGVLL